jgi:aerobic carbon-monoxide dehydrogenase medium subunit
MKPPQFEYVRAETAAGAVAALADCGEYARILAGGQSLIPLMNLRLSRPSHLVDVTHVQELDVVAEEGAEIVIGAAARQAKVESSDLVRRGCPLLVEALELVAHPPIRHRGTVCGSLAHADPASELAAVALTLDATFSIQNASGTRSVPAKEFFVGPFTTATSTGEMLRDVRVPTIAPSAGASIVEFTRTHGNFAIAGAVALVELAGDATVSRAALTIFGVSGQPQRATAAEQLLLGAEPTEQTVNEAADLALQDIECSSDMHGSAVYRARIGRVYARRALASAVSRAQGGGR